MGLGPKLAQGSVGLLLPRLELSKDGETLTIDGVTFEFFDAGGTEAPSELMFCVPQLGALHTAGVATRTFHNVLTPRGALGRGGTGPDAALRQGKAAFAAGNYRWAARLLQMLVFAHPDHPGAKSWLAATYGQLGCQAEAGRWRNIYLAATQDLRVSKAATGSNIISNEGLTSIPTDDLFDALANRFNPERMTGNEAIIQFAFPDTGERIAVDLRRSTMFPGIGASDNANTALMIDRSDLNRLLAQLVTIPKLVASRAASLTGHRQALLALLGVLDQSDANFAIVEP